MEDRNSISSMPIAQRVILGNVISPPKESAEEHYNQASIIKGLSTHNQLQRIELRVNGYRYNALTDSWSQSSKPLMNERGINKLMIHLEAIGDGTSFSNYDPKTIPKLVFFYLKNAYSSFVTYSHEFELEEERRDEVLNILLGFFLSTHNNAKNSGHRNTIRGVLSESMLGRALAGGSGSEPKSKGFFSRLNPFGRKD